MIKLKENTVVTLLTRERKFPKMVIDKIKEIECAKNQCDNIDVNIIYCKRNEVVDIISKGNIDYYLSTFKSDNSATMFTSMFKNKHNVTPIFIQFDDTDRYSGWFKIYNNVSATIEMSSFSKFINTDITELSTDGIDTSLWSVVTGHKSVELFEASIEKFKHNKKGIKFNLTVQMDDNDILKKASELYKLEGVSIIVLNENYNVLDLEHIVNEINNLYGKKISIVTMSANGELNKVENVTIHRDVMLCGFSESTNKVKVINKIL